MNGTHHWKHTVQQDTKSSAIQKREKLKLDRPELILFVTPEVEKVAKIFNQMALKRNPHEIEEMRERKKQKNRESAQRARDRFKAK